MHCSGAFTSLQSKVRRSKAVMLLELLRTVEKSGLLVWLEFEIKLEPLLLSCPFLLLLLLLLLRFVKFFWLRLVLETWNLVHTLRGSILSFFAKRIFWFDLNFYLYLMVWLEIGRLAYTCARDLKLGTHLEGVHTSIFCQKNFLVRLELVPVLNGLTWNWMFNLDLCYRLQTWYTPWGGPY